MAHETTVKNPGTYSISKTFAALLIVFIGVGVLTFFASVRGSPDRAWASFVLNHFYFMSLALGGLFFAALQWVTNAMWSAPVRRMSEAFTSYLPVVFVTFTILYFGIPEIYVWSYPELVHGDPVLEGKASYLNVNFFVIRNLIAIAIWVFFARIMVGNSISQDTTRSMSHTAKNQGLSPIFIILFALTYTMASFDQLMSLDPHWFSTMFGVYIFSGLFYANLASTCLLTLYLQRKGKLAGIVNLNHLHDLGKLMFAFTVFWAYIAFSQFMLIWYANLPEETGYFIHRFHGNWIWVSIFLVAGKFAVPFIALLPREAKRNPRTLGAVAVFMLVAQWIDFLWVVQPEFFKNGPVFGWQEIGITLGFLGVFGLVVARFLSRNNVVAIGDPRLSEAVFHHHQ